MNSNRSNFNTQHFHAAELLHIRLGVGSRDEGGVLSCRYPVFMTRGENLHPGKVTKERPTSYTHPNIWLSPKHQLLIMAPKSAFNLPDSGNCFQKEDE